MRASRQATDPIRRELEHEVNLAVGWAKEIVGSAGRMETLGVDPMLVNAITR
ncbi:hypothetical protein OG417_50435 [Actinoallomurus sp. NBC_01490]|uniref:hypothetical protein n=1 Tax=Actinoallomurus sp. NBC_01490 TaxID=2903557 RepID=UPI002E3459DD|nr:hypothetical protein [Actinoallomurus sp. NBC_01490]